MAFRSASLGSSLIVSFRGVRTNSASCRLLFAESVLGGHDCVRDFVDEQRRRPAGPAAELRERGGERHGEQRDDRPALHARRQMALECAPVDGGVQRDAGDENEAQPFMGELVQARVGMEEHQHAGDGHEAEGADGEGRDPLARDFHGNELRLNSAQLYRRRTYGRLNESSAFKLFGRAGLAAHPIARGLHPALGVAALLDHDIA